MKYFSKNLTFLRKKNDENQGEVALKLGFSNRSRYSNYEAGHSKPDLSTLIKVSEYFNVSIDDLLFKDLEKSDNLSAISEPVVSYGKKDKIQFVTVDGGMMDNIVMVDVKAAAGYPENIAEPSYFKNLPTFSLPGSDFRNGSFRCFQVEGDIMSDTLYPNDFVIGRYLDGNFNDIREGYIHVVVTRSSVLVKRLLNRVKDRKKIVLVSDNEEYPHQEVNIEEVLEIWLVKAKLSFYLPSKRGSLEKRLTKLEDRVNLLEKSRK